MLDHPGARLEVLDVDDVHVGAGRVTPDEHGRQVGAEQLLDPGLTGGDRAHQHPVDETVAEDVLDGPTGLPGVEHEHEALVELGRGAGDRVGHRRAVGVEAEISARDDEPDHGRAPAGEVAGGPIGPVTERSGDPLDPLPDLGAHPPTTVQRSGCGRLGDAAHPGNVVQRHRTVHPSHVSLDPPSLDLPDASKRPQLQPLVLEALSC